MTSGRPGLWAIVGATGTGKTALSLELAKQLNEHASRPAEIVNADAMQLYRGMNIGTAKLPVDERRGIAHHLFDALDPAEEASVAWYQQAAREAIDTINRRGHDAILVGGSGLYVSSVIFDFQFPPRDENLRRKLEAEQQRTGTAPLLDQLRGLDPTAADAVDAQNPRRVIRALEVALLGGNAQVTLPQSPTLWRAHSTIIGVRSERAELVARLDRRVEHMWAEGLLEEVAGLRELGLERSVTASRAIGYAQAISQLRGDTTEAEAIAETQMLTRRYARRQVSWFKRYPGVRWLDAGEAVPSCWLDA